MAASHEKSSSNLKKPLDWPHEQRFSQIYIYLLESLCGTVGLLTGSPGGEGRRGNPAPHQSLQFLGHGDAQSVLVRSSHHLFKPISIRAGERDKETGLVSSRFKGLRERGVKERRRSGGSF